MLEIFTAGVVWQPRNGIASCCMCRSLASNKVEMKKDLLARLLNFCEHGSARCPVRGYMMESVSVGRDCVIIGQEEGGYCSNTLLPSGLGF